MSFPNYSTNNGLWAFLLVSITGVQQETKEWESEEWPGVFISSHLLTDVWSTAVLHFKALAVSEKCRNIGLKCPWSMWKKSAKYIIASYITHWKLLKSIILLIIILDLLICYKDYCYDQFTVQIYFSHPKPAESRKSVNHMDQRPSISVSHTMWHCVLLSQSHAPSFKTSNNWNTTTFIKQNWATGSKKKNTKR